MPALAGRSRPAQLFGEQLGAQLDGRAHEALAPRRDAIAPRPRQLGHETMRPQQADPATDAPALSASLRGVARPRAEQRLRQLTIAKATQGMFAPQRGLKQG